MEFALPMARVGHNGIASTQPSAVQRSERLDDRQDDDADQQQRRDLVEHPIPALRVRIAVGGELLHSAKHAP